MVDAAQGFTIVRNFDATPHQIWNAWVDPDEVAEWWHPGEMVTTRDQVPDQRLVFTWGDAADSPTVTVTIRNAGDLTQTTVDLRGAEGFKGDNYIYDRWESTMDALAGHLGQTAVHG
jgi:uncharacterized protein YndB with AHSA1/START domain